MRILILTASVGNGHNSTAKNLKEIFLEKNSNVVEIVDMYDSYASKFINWCIGDAYSFLCKKLITVYNYFFKIGEKFSFENKYKSFANKTVNSLLHGLLNKIYDFKPDLIICTYIFSAIAIGNLKRAYLIPAKVACMTLDYGVSPYWECACDALDYMFLTNEEMIDLFLERGYKRDVLYPVGIPVANKFSNLNDKSETLKKLGLRDNLLTIVIMKSGFFPISEKSLIKSFKKITTKLQIIIINGTDKKSKLKFDKLLKRVSLIHDVKNLEFVDVVDYFSVADLIVGKGGGLTTTESLTAMIPSLIVNNIPQQEIYNKEYLVKNGCALSINRKNLSTVLQDLANNKEKVTEMKENCKKIRKTYVLESFYNILKDVPKANYSNVEPLYDNKRAVVKKVDKARKYLIKLQKIEKHKSKKYKKYKKDLQKI